MIVQFGDENEALLTTLELNRDGNDRNQIIFMTLISDIKIKIISKDGEQIDEFYITDAKITIDKIMRCQEDGRFYNS